LEPRSLWKQKNSRGEKADGWGGRTRQKNIVPPNWKKKRTEDEKTAHLPLKQERGWNLGKKEKGQREKKEGQDGSVAREGPKKKKVKGGGKERGQ